MQTRRTFADFIHAENAVFKHAKGMRDIFGLEFHPFHEIFLFLDGDAEFISGDFRTVLQKNTLVVIPKESFHHFVVHCAEEDYHRYVLNFTPFGKLQRLMEEKLQEICVLAASGEILAHFARLAAHTEDADRYKKELLLEAAITDILLAIDPAESVSQAGSAVAIRPEISRAVRYINENVATVSNVEEVAAFVNLSPSHFSHLFKKELHIPPGKYLLEKKLVMANRLIHSGVGAVAAAEVCGFGNYSGFYRMYKKAFGASPSKG